MLAGILISFRRSRIRYRGLCLYFERISQRYLVIVKSKNLNHLLIIIVIVMCTLSYIVHEFS